MKNHILTTLAVALLLLACGGASTPESSADHAADNASAAEEAAQESSEPTFYGSYVSDGYAQKDEGYDWVAISISEISPTMVKISVRSRADKKKPTCTLDLVGNLQGNIIQIYGSDGSINFTFSGETLTVTGSPEDNSQLTFYCSGGGSIAGIYQKIDGSPDQTQIDLTSYMKMLSMGNYMFFLEAKDGQLTVTPTGLEASNSPITLPYDGEIINAEIGDLNADQSPEVMVYVQDGHAQSVLGYSVNNGKSMSTVAFTPTTDNEDINEGFNGHNEFSMVEGTLAERFPLFENDNKTGTTRQIQYKLVDGEASRQLIVDTVTEY